MEAPNTTNLGIALGGGGIRGLAHIPILKVLDEAGVRPARIAGTSMGAVIGALYATGMTADAIEERVRKHIVLKRDNLKSIIKKRKQLINWIRVFGPEKDRGGLVDADGLFQHLFDELLDLTFEKLPTPFFDCHDRLLFSRRRSFPRRPFAPRSTCKHGSSGCLCATDYRRQNTR